MKHCFLRRFSPVLLLAACFTHSSTAFALGEKQHVIFTADSAAFPIAQSGITTPIYIDSADWPGAIHAASNLSSDTSKP